MERVDVSDNKTRRFNNKPTRIESSDLNLYASIVARKPKFLPKYADM